MLGFGSCLGGSGWVAELIGHMCRWRGECVPERHGAKVGAGLKSQSPCRTVNTSPKTAILHSEYSTNGLMTSCLETILFDTRRAVKSLPLDIVSLVSICLHVSY